MFASGICGVIKLSLRCFFTFDGVQRRVTGLYEDGRLARLSGLRVAMMLPCFQVVGIVFCEYEKLAMFVSTCMPCGPRWMRCRLLILIGPTAAEYLRFLMMSFVCCGVNGV